MLTALGQVSTTQEAGLPASSVAEAISQVQELEVVLLLVVLLMWFGVENEHKITKPSLAARKLATTTARRTKFALFCFTSTHRKGEADHICRRQLEATRTTDYSTANISSDLRQCRSGDRYLAGIKLP